MLDVLTKNNIPYLLHGSRSKIPHKVKSYTDWDIAIQDTQDNEWAFVRDGWKRIINLDYQDDDTVSIFEKEVEGSKFQISLRKDFERFQKIWYWLDSDFYATYIWKQSPKALPREDVSTFFNHLYRVYDAGKSDSFPF